MTIHTIQCYSCKDIIYSRARHDMRACTCGATMIDGGFDYIKITYNPNVGIPYSGQIELDVTKDELYDDWNLSKNKYGLIKEDSNGHV